MRVTRVAKRFPLSCDDDRCTLATYSRYERRMTHRYAPLALSSLLASCGSPPAPAALASSPPPSAPTAASSPAGAIRIVDGIVSAYLLPIDANQAALVDCGMDPEATAILETLATHGLTADSITAIFVTHLHGDHVGGCERFPNAKLYLAGADADPSIVPVTDGQTTTLGSLSVTAYSVPGHTADSIAYLANGVLYLGDAAMLSDDGRTVKASPRRFQGATHEPDTAKLNVPPLRQLHERLVAQKADVRQLAFGHSAPLDNPAALANPE